MDFLSILLLLFFIWLTFKIVPAVLGFAFSVFLVILQVVGILILLPVLGLLCFFVDAVFILIIVGLVKIIL